MKFLSLAIAAAGLALAAPVAHAQGTLRIGVAPQTEKVIVLTSWREDYIDRVYRLFDD